MNPFYVMIANRANHRCEYCRAPEVVFNFPFEVEHILPLSRQGSDDTTNLALACRACNLRKGSRIGGIDPVSGTEQRLFHPRQDLWNAYFRINADTGEIVGLSAIGRVTIGVLEMNSAVQVTARQLWIRLGLFE
ncbi:MAG: HNH endonuclease [Elainella sp.]